ncbi:MAG: MBL fold metallo-hydrolase [Longimicrobiales bacterium]
MKLTFLGTRGEIEARRRRHWRHSALLITHERRRVLIDCGADWVRRLARIRPHAIVLTHAHPDHAFGLAQGAPCVVMATEACWQTIERFPIEQRRTIRPGRPVRVHGLRIEAFEVEHSVRAPAVGYRISAGHGSVFYAPDLVSIVEQRKALHGVQLYIGDGASLTRPLVRRRGRRLIGHAPVSTQLRWCAQEGVARALITHCGTQIVTGNAAVMAARVRELGERHGVQAELAHDGMTRIVRG